VRQSQILQHIFPALEDRIVGDNYPVTKIKELLANVFQVAQFAGIGLIFVGEKLFDMLGMPVPGWQRWISNNKLGSGLGIMLAGNIGQQMRMSGAFEVFIHGDHVFSRIATGTVPAVEEMVEVLIGYGYTPVANYQDVLLAIHTMAQHR